MKETIKKTIQDLWIALRPLSLTLALSSTTIGILFAYRNGAITFAQGRYDALYIGLVTIAGMCILACANLINDFYEGTFKYDRSGETTYNFLGYERTLFDLIVFITSLMCLGLAGLIGLFIMFSRNFNLIWIGLIGMIGSYAYTGEPFVYKRHGLGTVLSFILVGPLMVQGAYMVFDPNFTIMPMLLSIPASLMLPLMMLSNEIRDYEQDKAKGIKTATVIFGIDKGYLAYRLVAIISYILILIYVGLGLLPLASLIVLLTIPLALKAYRTVAQEYSGIRITNILHILFNTLFIISIML